MIPIIKTENDLRKLAGLALRETSVQLDDIVDKHADAMASVMNGETSLYDHQEFYDELYDYFLNSGEMPYGIAKARDGDPDQWIEEYLQDEYGSQGFTEPMDGDFDSAMASAGHGTDEDYGSYDESVDVEEGGGGGFAAALQAKWEKEGPPPANPKKTKKMPPDWFKKHGKKVGGWPSETQRASDNATKREIVKNSMNHFAEVVANGNKSVQVLTEDDAKTNKQVVTESVKKKPTTLKEYIEQIDESFWVGGQKKKRSGAPAHKYPKKSKPLKPFKTKGGPKHKPTANVALAGGGTTGPGGRGTSP